MQHGQSGLFVFEVDANKTTKRRDIKVAHDDGDRAVLSDGLPAGTMIVTAGQSRVGDGTKVSVHEGTDAQTPQQSAAK